MLDHLLYSCSAGGKDLSNDTQIRVIKFLKRETCTKMLRNISEKLGAMFPSTTLSYFVVRIICLMILSRQFEPEAGPVELQQLQQKKRKGEKVKAKKIRKTNKTEILI